MELDDAIDTLEQGLIAEAEGAAENMVKTHVAWGAGSTLHAIGASFPRAGFVGTKTWAHTDRGATPLLLLFDANTGQLRAVIEAFALGMMRTASIAGVATRWLSREESSELAIIGTGKQAASQVAAILAVRPIRRVRVFSPREESRRRFANRLRDEFELEVFTAAHCREAVEGAGIITTVTRATEPFLESEMVAPGSHINSLGAIVSSRAELAQDLLARCDDIVVDSKPQAQKLSRELIDHCGSNQGGWERVHPLSRVVKTEKRRPPGADLTLFKSLGMGISDLSVGIEIYQRAVRRGVGRVLPHPRRAKPRLQSGRKSTRGGFLED